MASPLVANSVAQVVDLSALPAGQAKFQLIKSQVEAALEKKVSSALTVREKPAAILLPTGVAEVDTLLCGGVPRGALSEITGPASSGRTSLLHSLLAQVAAREEFCALVDAASSFDPASAKAAGVELGRLLWIRCGSSRNEKRETRTFGSSTRNPDKQFSALAVALRVADLLVTSGGFGLVALDLGDLSPDAGRRVPLTTWFRFRRAVEYTPTAFVVLEREAHAKSCAEVVLQLQSSDFSLRSSAQDSPTHAQIFAGSELRMELIRGHARKRDVGSVPAHFATRAAWCG